MAKKDFVGDQFNTENSIISVSKKLQFWGGAKRLRS